jgi:uncharacterized protein YifN (PemK superfamily)
MRLLSEQALPVFNAQVGRNSIVSADAVQTVSAARLYRLSQFEGSVSAPFLPVDDLLRAKINRRRTARCVTA